jgi:phosphoribosyl 1,2-cyclic phosphodiesterase
MEPLILHFLGTGGGRHTMSTQRRRTAGIRLIKNKNNIHIDPGPGALVHSIYAGLTPMKLDGVLVTHCHPDHYTDAEPLIEAMTQGTTRKKGVIAAAKSVIDGNEETDRSISRYHQKLVSTVSKLLPDTICRIGGVSFQAVEALHGDPDTIGLVIDDGEHGKIGYTSDTELIPSLMKAYGGLRLLIACTMWPRGDKLEGHLNTDDALQLIKATKPKCAVTTHYGFKLLNVDPVKEASWLSDESGIPVISARDGMKVTLTEEITVQGSRKADEPLYLRV